MKILFIDVNCKTGSTGSIVYNLHKECLNNNIESAICYGRGPKIKEANIYKFGIPIETLFHALLTRITGFTGRFSFFSTLRLKKYIKKFKPDIVHIHELHAYFVNDVSLLSFLKKKNIKVIFTNHCEFLYTGKCGHAKECTKYSNQCGKCPHLKEYPSVLLFDHTRSMLLKKKRVFEGWNDCLFVSPSHWLNNKMDLSFLKEKERYVIPNGIDISNFNFSNCPQKDKKIVLSVAPNIMSEMKGGERVLKLAKRFEKDNIEFVLVGALDKTIPSKLPNNVNIFGLVKDKEDLLKFYRMADVFLICSSFENYPTTCIEAQCCGLPVLGFDVGGVKETILDGNGKTVSFEDYMALENEIIKLMSSKIDHKLIANKSLEYFSNNKMFQQYLSLYKKLML